MKKNMLLGICISVFNLLFYAAFLDLFFDSRIFYMVFGFDLLKFFGKDSISVGVVAISIAILLEVMSYKVIRRDTVRKEKDMIKEL